MNTETWKVVIPLVVGSLTGFIAMVGMIISKDQKITDHRQEWINLLREEIASFIGLFHSYITTQSIIRHLQNQNEDKDAIIVLRESLERRKEFDRTHQKALLLLNPTKHSELIAALAEMRNCIDSNADAFVGIDTKQRVVEKTTSESQKLLKATWERVKSGERSYKALKYFALAIIVVSLLSAIFFGIGFNCTGSSS